MNETKLSPDYVCCATCQYWSSACTRYEYPVYVIVDGSMEKRGQCGKTFLGSKTDAYASCQNWSQRYK